MALVFKLKHYKVKTPFCDKCGKMVSNRLAKIKTVCNHCFCKL